MLCNVAGWDRSLRFLIAVLTLAYAFAGGPFWFWILGIYLLATSAWALCPVYSFFRLRTLR